VASERLQTLCLSLHDDHAVHDPALSIIGCCRNRSSWGAFRALLYWERMMRRTALVMIGLALLGGCTDPYDPGQRALGGGALGGAGGAAVGGLAGGGKGALIGGGIGAAGGALAGAATTPSPPPPYGYNSPRYGEYNGYNGYNGGYRDDYYRY
jgi:hypothetical protein